jgi:hypothetical protein
MNEVLDVFERVVQSESFARASCCATEKLGIGNTRGISFIPLMQFRMYESHTEPDAVYYTAQSSGYFRADLAAIPLKGVGVKIALSDLEQGCFNELYMMPLSQRDLLDGYENSDRIDLDKEMIGVGLHLEQKHKILEYYYWERQSSNISDSLEVRHNLITDVKTPYYRHSISGDTPQGNANEAFMRLLQSLKPAVEDNLIHDVVVYANKMDKQGIPYMGFYISRSI